MIERTKNWIRKRLAPPSKFAKKSFRTIVLPGGKQLVVGCPKGHWHPGRKRKCDVGMRKQSLRIPR
jgi:hypothetical protein